MSEHQTAMTRRRMLKLVGVLTAGTALAACGATPTATLVPPMAPTQSAVPTKPAAKKTVEVWHGYATGVMAAAMQRCIDTFNQITPDFEAKAEVIPWTDLYKKVVTSIAGGNPPDVYRMFGPDALAASNAPKGLAVKLDDYVSRVKDFNLDDFWPGVRSAMMYKGSIYALSISAQVDILYYNKDRMRQVGIDPTNLPADLEGWEEYGRRLTEISNGNIVNLGFVPWIPFWNAMMLWISVFGGQVYDEAQRKVTANNPTVVKVLEWFKTYADKFGAEQIQAYAGTFGGNMFGRDSPQGVYYTGKLAIWVMKTSRYNQMAEYGPNVDFGIRTVPSPKGVKGWPATVTANNYLVPTHANNPDGGFAFANFMSSHTVPALKAITDASVPSRKSLALNPEIDGSPLAKGWLKLARDEILPAAAPLPNLPSFNFLEAQLEDAAQSVVFKGAKAKDVLDSATEAAQREADKGL